MPTSYIQNNNLSIPPSISPPYSIIGKMSKVNLSDLIDEIDHEDKVSGVSKSLLKKRLEGVSKSSVLSK